MKNLNQTKPIKSKNNVIGLVISLIERNASAGFGCPRLDDSCTLDHCTCCWLYFLILGHWLMILHILYIWHILITLIIWIFYTGNLMLNLILKYNIQRFPLEIIAADTN